jgi:transcriptional regulator with XRE-family HTH domain
LSSSTLYRLDRESLVEELGEILRRRGLDWAEAARQMGLSRSTLTRLRQGKSVDTDALVTIFEWARLRPSAFTVPR